MNPVIVIGIYLLGFIIGGVVLGIMRHSDNNRMLDLFDLEAFFPVAAFTIGWPITVVVATVVLLSQLPVLLVNGVMLGYGKYLNWKQARYLARFVESAEDIGQDTNQVG